MQSGGSDSRRPCRRAQLLLEEALVEARVVRDEQRVAREREEAAARTVVTGGAVRSSCSPQAGQPGDRLGQRDPGIDERLEGVDELEPPHAHGPDLADAVARRREPGRLEVEDDELGLLERRVGLPSASETRGADADEPAVAGGDARRAASRRARPRSRRGEERAGRLDRRERAALLERVHQPVERVERKLHPPDESEHTFALQAEL